MKLHKTYKIYIRSTDVPKLDSEFNSAMAVNLKAGLNLHSDERYRIKLDSAEIPHTFYNVSKDVFNDQIYLDGTMIQLIPSGNYSVYDLYDYLTSISSFPYSATYEEISSKITLTNTDSTDHIINFTEGFAKLTGFIFQDRQINASSSLTSFNTVNLQSIHSLFIHTSLASSNVISTETNGFQNIIGKVPVNRLPYEILSYEPNYSTFDVELDDRSISTFNISIKDQNGSLVQFNGVNFELSLLLEVYKEEVQIPEPTRRAELAPPPIVPQVVPEPVVLDPIIEQPPVPLPIIPEPTLEQLPDSPRPTLNIPKSRPIDIPLSNIPFSNHELHDAVLAASLLDLEGLL